MLFAINYSFQAAELFTAGKIRLDRFKTPDWPDMIAEASEICPVAIHFNLNAGNGSLKEKDWSYVWDLLQQTNTPYINLHLSPNRKHFPGLDDEHLSPEHANQVEARVRADLEVVLKRFGPSRVILENVPYRGPQDKVLPCAVDPQFISHLIESCDCGFLLDISHARISARQLGVEEDQYLTALPVNRLRELHFTGLHFLDGVWRDHMSVLEEDWPALDWALERIRLNEWARPWLLALEYGGVGEKFVWRSDPDVIATQAPVIYTKIKDI